MKTIWKYQLNPDTIINIEMPKGAEILTVQTQFEKPCIWALVEPNQEKEVRQFYMLGTGNPFEIGTKHIKYIGTFQV